MPDSESYLLVSIHQWLVGKVFGLGTSVSGVELHSTHMTIFGCLLEIKIQRVSEVTKSIKHIGS